MKDLSSQNFFDENKIEILKKLDGEKRYLLPPQDHNFFGENGWEKLPAIYQSH